MVTTEHTINDVLASLLRQTRHRWKDAKVILSENTRVFRNSSKKPDILIAEPNVSPVVVETEVLPASTVELDARSRIGECLAGSGRAVLSTVAVRMPARLREHGGERLHQELGEANDLDLAVFTGSLPDSAERWPEAGWMRGGVPELSLLVQSASIPPAIIEAAVDLLVVAVSDTAGLLDEIAETHPEAVEKICDALRQQDSEQTRRMAMTILADAFLFHEMLSGIGGELVDIRAIEELRDGRGRLSKAAVLGQWRKILKINYWPIFDIARKILEFVPTAHASPIVERIAETSAKLLENQLARSHDLTGAIFQKLIADRKFLAAFYTTPAAAELLAGLVFSRRTSPPWGGTWSSLEDVLSARVADFACGTGTLLSAVYRRIRQEFELSGGDSRELHGPMMGESLVGCDIMPAAAHLTASMLSGTHPSTTYTKGAVMTMPYGRQDDGSFALGSLDLLRKQRAISLLATVAKVVEGTGEVGVDPWVAIPDGHFDLVIMNPPFTRATGHEGEKIGVPIPMFAAFGSPEKDQRAMSRFAKELTRGTSAHGNAGEASIFLVLADRKLKEGGALALVMPLSLMAGQAWRESRRLLKEGYEDLILVTIAAEKTEDASFSADTGMAECLVFGRKAAGGSGRATFLTLYQRPASTGEGAEIARRLSKLVSAEGVRRLEAGPVGGTPVEIGDETVGYAVDAPLDDAGRWRLSRVADVSLAQTAFQLSARGLVWLPGQDEHAALPLKMAPISELGTVGPYHMDISGRERSGGAIRGPFDIKPLPRTGVPTYPVLWSHTAEQQRTLQVVPDGQGVIRKGKDESEELVIRSRADRIWNTASNCHFNRDFRFNSQSTAFAFTPDPCIGGRAWPSVLLESEESEKAIVVWGNSSFGLLLYWWWATKQHSGRGSITITVLPDFPVLDVRRLSPQQMQAACSIFDELLSSPLRPLNELDEDEVRHELDRRLWTEVLGFEASYSASGGPIDLVRRKLAAEPSVTGGKH